MLKRGQVSVFIIIGILILLISGIFFYYFSVFETKEQGSHYPFSDPIKTFVDQCLETSANKALTQVLSQGGYFVYPSTLNLFEFEEEGMLYKLPYYFSYGKTDIPSLEQIAKQVSQGTEQYLIECLNDFSSFRKEGLIIKVESPILTTTFSDTKTITSLEYPITVTKGESTQTFENFRFIKPFNFKQKYEQLATLLEFQQEASESFLVGSFSSLAAKQQGEFSFEQLGHLGSTVVVNLSYKNTPTAIDYSFVLYYDWTDLGEEEIKQEPSHFDVLYPQPLLLTTSEVVTYKPQVKGSNLIFKADPSDLPLDKNTGVITINPQNYPNDEYLYYIIIENEEGQVIVKSLEINVNVEKEEYPSMKKIKNQKAVVGQNFSLQVETVRKGTLPITFSDQATLFDVNSRTGLISFVPTQLQRGTYSIRVDAKNEFASTWQRFELVIE